MGLCPSPGLAVTMGVGTILESRQCLLLATGAASAEALRQAVEGPVTAQVTASALQLHRDAIVVVDRQAAALLAHGDYYREVENAQAEIQAGHPGAAHPPNASEPRLSCRLPA